MPTQPNYNFLEDYIIQVLEQSGLGELTEENKKKYLPQLIAKAEYQIGLALVPKLNDKDAEVFAQMMDNGKATPKQWQEFWYGAVPSFDEVVQKVLVNFGKQCKELLKS